MGRFNPEDENWNWSKELSGESITNWFYICHSLEETETFVTAAIFELLTGTKYHEHQVMYDGNPQTAAINDMAEASYDASEAEGFDAEWQEAVRVAEEARQTLSGGRYYEKEYGYLMSSGGSRKIGGKISVEFKGDEEQRSYVISSPYREVAQRDGYPANFLHREGDAQVFEPKEGSITKFLTEKLAFFLEKGKNVVHEVLQEATFQHFAAVVKEVPFSDAKTQKEYLWLMKRIELKMVHGDASTLYEQLTPEQKLVAHKSRIANVWYQPKILIETEDASADMWIGVSLANVTAQYDPAIQAMSGSIGSSDKDICRMMLWNNFHPDSTHEGLKAIRERALSLWEAMGLKKLE